MSTMNPKNIVGNIESKLGIDKPANPDGTHEEGPIAKAIEQQTARIPSDAFLWLAGGAALASLALQMTDRKEASNFLGQWVPSILICGLYNKIVKLHGNDGPR